MVQKEKLIQFYFAQYNECAKRFKKKSNTRPGDYEKRIQTLGKMLKHTHLSPNNLVRLEEYHGHSILRNRYSSVNSEAVLCTGATAHPKNASRRSILNDHLGALAGGLDSSPLGHGP